MPARTYPVALSLLQHTAAPGVGNLGGQKFLFPNTRNGNYFSNKNWFHMSGTAVISYHPRAPGRESRLSVPGLRGVCVSLAGTGHRDVYSVSGREVQLLQAFLTGYSCLALRFYPVPPLGNVDY